MIKFKPKVQKFVVKIGWLYLGKYGADTNQQFARLFTTSEEADVECAKWNAEFPKRKSKVVMVTVPPSRKEGF